MTTIHILAGALYDAFEHKTRANGDAFVSLKDGSPDWMQEAIHEAHGDMLPDDWRYRAVMDAAEAIYDAGADGDTDDAHGAFIDAVDVYNHDLIRWLGSHGARPDYVDNAVDEFGWPDGGLMAAIQLGQAEERGEVFDSVLAFLQAVAEESEGESDA